MRTQLMQEPLVGIPWLEHDPRHGAIEKTPLRSFPFTIGRIDEADLCIESEQVSREHAVITERGKTYHLKDLKSTNGTFVNGRRIEEVTLADGDQVAFASVLFTFFSGAAADDRHAPTQVISTAQGQAQHAQQAVAAIRRMHEIVTCRGVETLFQPIVELASRETLGYEALASGGAGDAGQARCEQWAGAIECRAVDRLRHLFRRLAAEDAADLPRGRLFLAIAAAEAGAGALVDHLCQMRDFIGKSRQLVIEIPDSAVRNLAACRELLTRLRDARFEVAFDGYASGHAHIAEHKDSAPDFLKFAPSLLKSIQWSKERQRQVQLVVRASHDIGSAVIATGAESDADLKVCLDMGCAFAQGGLFGIAQPSSAFVATAAAVLPQGPARHPSHV